jgi:xylan 1,4-beta-xylosidase
MQLMKIFVPSGVQKPEIKASGLSMDLQKECTVNAVQINYAENDANLKRTVVPDIYYQYLLEYSSTDNKTWKTLADKTQSTNRCAARLH